jgi:hypothetical protein
MLRRIWHRAAALALPMTLAICLPPLAVIALNLHAESAGSKHAHAGTTFAGTAKNAKYTDSVGNVHLSHKTRPVRVRSVEGAIDRSSASSSFR